MSNTRSWSALIVASSGLALAAPSFALSNPFTEDFSANAANWLDVAFQPADWFATGGPDGSSYSSATFNFLGALAAEDKTVARGQDSFGASGGAFVGNWLAGGVTQLSFSIRHDAGVALTMFARVASSANFPGAISLTTVPVPSGQWTTVTLPLDPALWILELPVAGFPGVFGAVGNIQLGARTPASLAGVNQVVRFDFDKVSIVPTPGSTAVLILAATPWFRRRR